jgi:uncharacterized protein (DUF305 family)
MKKIAVAFAIAGFSLASAATFGQTPHGGSMHGGAVHDAATAMQPKGDVGPASQAYNAANRKMHGAMDIAYSGNADVDFAKSMIPHHAGAVDMAKVVLSFGKDPEIKKLAQAIIKAQETEIAQMQEWLKKHAK